MAGKCWVYAFLKRNPSISLRLPEPTSMNRVLGFNKTEISLFFRNLEEITEKNAYPEQNEYSMLMKQVLQLFKNLEKFMRLKELVKLSWQNSWANCHSCVCHECIGNFIHSTHVYISTTKNQAKSQDWRAHWSRI